MVNLKKHPKIGLFVMPYFTINRKDGKEWQGKESMIESRLIRRKMGKSIINLKSIMALILRQVRSSILQDVDLNQS